LADGNFRFGSHAAMVELIAVAGFALMVDTKPIARPDDDAGSSPRQQMRDYTPKEKAKITAGAVTALVIVGWLTVIAFAFLFSA